jgi:hypothetical protein
MHHRTYDVPRLEALAVGPAVAVDGPAIAVADGERGRLGDLAVEEHAEEEQTQQNNHSTSLLRRHLSTIMLPSISLLL